MFATGKLLLRHVRRRAPLQVREGSTVANFTVKPYYVHAFIIDPIRGYQRWPSHMDESDFYLCRDYKVALEKLAGGDKTKRKALKFTVVDGIRQATEEEQSVFPEQHSLLLFPSALRLDHLKRSHIPALVKLLLTNNGPPDIRELAGQLGPDVTVSSRPPGLDLFVCVHGNRDHRCGERGPRLLEWLKDASSRTDNRTRVWACSHIGGHRFAGNMIIFPHGDWYGCINQPQDAAAVVDAVHHQSSLEHDDNLPSVGVRHMWRGRMGMSNEQYARLKEDL